MKRADFIRLCWLILALVSTHIAVAQVSDGTLRRIRVPILMYHYVSPLPEDADEVRRGLTIVPELFEAHMQYLADSAYTPISLYQLYDALEWGAALPPNPVVLTFDDGYIDHFRYVFPLLQRHGFTGTFFVITGLADEGNPAHLSWDQIREMEEAGMDMEVHTKSHLSLDGRDRDFLVYELLGSRESLRAHSETNAMMLSYPIGHYDLLTLQIVQELDFRMAVTTQPGVLHDSTDRLEIPRLRIGENAGVGVLAALLRTSE